MVMFDKTQEATDALEETMLLIGALGAADIASSAPSATGMSVATINLMVSLLEVRSGDPFREAAKQWDEFGGAIREEHERIRDLRDKIVGSGEQEGSWSGPGADQFDEYVSSDLKWPLSGLDDAATEVAKILESCGDRLDEGFDLFCTLSVTMIGVNLAAKFTYYCLPHGPLLHESIVLASNLLLATGILLNAVTVVTALTQEWSESEELAKQLEFIGEETRSSGQHLGEAANYLKGAIPDELDDHSEWEPA